MPLGRPVRVAGSLVVDGIRRTWSVAEGRRGRRWRSTAELPGTGVVTWVAETDADGAFTKLEAATATRLLTLHREADGALHGHVAGPDGIAALALPAPAPELVHLDDPLSLAAAIAGLGAIGVGEGAALRAAIVSPELGVAVVDVEVTRVRADHWESVLPGGRRLHATLDADGLPVAYAASARPMEG